MHLIALYCIYCIFIFVFFSCQILYFVESLRNLLICCIIFDCCEQLKSQSALNAASSELNKGDESNRVRYVMDLVNIRTNILL